MPQIDDTKSALSEKASFDECDALQAISGATDPAQAFTRLSCWSKQAATLQITADLLEDQLLAGGFELLRLMLQHHLNLRAQAEVPLALVEQEKTCETRLSHRREHKRLYQSVFGTVELKRMGFGARGIESIHPLDEELNLPKRRYSHPLQKRAAKLCGRGPFDEAVEQIQETTAANFPKRQLQQVVVEIAQDFEAFYEKRRESSPQPEETGPLLVVGVDCKGVPKRRTRQEAQDQRGKRLGKGEKKSKRKMATVASVHSTHPFVRSPQEVVSRLMDPEPVELEKKRPKAEQRRVWASLHKSKDELFAEVAEELKQRDPKGEKVVVCVMDGEKALKNRASEHLKKASPGLLLILDIIHVIEYLWKAAYVFCEEGSQQAHDWVRERLLLILEGKIMDVVRELQKQIAQWGLTEEIRKPVDTACGYFSNNIERMQYHKYLKAGLPIGSGCVEGACGHLVKDRMERTGASWDVDGKVAEAVLQIRAIDKSGDFEDYWNFHLSQEKAYNYDRRWQPA